MVVTGWNNGDWNPSGAGYGIKLEPHDRDREFDRSWRDVTIQLEGNGDITVQISPSFWRVCKELRKQEIGERMQTQGFMRWPPRKPPRFELNLIQGRKFKLSMMTSLGK